MNNITIETTSPNIDIIPKFSELSNPPKSSAEALWILTVAFVPIVAWGLKSFIDFQIQSIKDVHSAKMEEDKIELAQRDALINNLQDQNNRLINEVFILRRTMDYSGNLTSTIPERKP